LDQLATPGQLEVQTDRVKVQTGFQFAPEQLRQGRPVGLFFVFSLIGTIARGQAPQRRRCRQPHPFQGAMMPRSTAGKHKSMAL